MTIMMLVKNTNGGKYDDDLETQSDNDNMKITKKADAFCPQTFL